MENRGGSATVGGTGFMGLLAIVFIVLKLCKIINWSWIWVLSPIWISWLIFIIIAIGMIIWIKKG